MSCEAAETLIFLLASARVIVAGTEAVVLNRVSV
jgi:hypothetical protein